MKTLVYFASGPLKKEYYNIPYDQIYLVDKIFKESIINDGKITCLGMDCLKSVWYMYQQKIMVDCMVSINHGLVDGGGTYSLNSDMFLGFCMLILKDEFIWLRNKTKRRKSHDNGIRVSMDFPYLISEVSSKEKDYLNPRIFTNHESHIQSTKNLRMKKVGASSVLILENKVVLKIIHDSIWNYYHELDKLFLSFTHPSQSSFFESIPKIDLMSNRKFIQTINTCIEEEKYKIGFTPWKDSNYSTIITELNKLKVDSPLEISLFHLNKNDYQTLGRLPQRKI